MERRPPKRKASTGRVKGFGHPQDARLDTCRTQIDIHPRRRIHLGGSTIRRHKRIHTVKLRPPKMKASAGRVKDFGHPQDARLGETSHTNKILR